MDKELKQQHEDIAQFAEDRAQQLLDKAVNIGTLHGPQAVIGELVEAGSLLASAAALRERAK